MYECKLVLFFIVFAVFIVVVFVFKLSHMKFEVVYGIFWSEQGHPA